MDGFTFFKSYYESAQHLSNKDQAAFYKLIMDYMFTGQEPSIDGHLMGFWLLIKPNLDTSKSRSKSGQKKSKQNQNKIKTESKSSSSPLEDKDKDKDKDNKHYEYHKFLFQLKKEVLTPTKVTKTKEGLKLFKSISDKKQLKDDYIKHQIDKKEYAQRITAFMEDYLSNKKNNVTANSSGLMVNKSGEFFL